MTLLDDIPVIDTDSHITEPADLWTSRVSKRFVDDAPRVVPDPDTGLPRWQVGKHMLVFATKANHAGWKDFHPGFPPTYEDADPGGWDPNVRLGYMDRMGIYSQVLYPNILAFQSFAFLDCDPALALECVRVYNDFQAEFASADPDRFIPIMFLPFWDVDASVKEIDRCVELGFKGINFGLKTDNLGFPSIRTDHWDPILSRAQDLELSVNFHVGFSRRTAEEMAEKRVLIEDELYFAMDTALLFLSNADGIAEVIMLGLCERFPRLNFVSVESGFGYIPFLLEALDWHFINSNLGALHPGRLLPSEYFRRQVYATFWFETGVHRQVDLYPGNVMFESDYPHATSLSPGPGSHALAPRETIRQNLAGIEDSTLRKILYGTAAKIYKVKLPDGF